MIQFLHKPKSVYVISLHNLYQYLYISIHLTFMLQPFILFNIPIIDVLALHVYMIKTTTFLLILTQLHAIKNSCANNLYMENLSSTT